MKQCYKYAILLPALVILVLGTAGPLRGQDNKTPNPRYVQPPKNILNTKATLLDDIALGGFIRAFVGANGALGTGSAVALIFDPDGTAGPLAPSEVTNEGFFEERWVVEYDGPGGNVNLGNATTATGIPGFVETNTSSPGILQSTGTVTTPDGLLRIDQVVTLRNLSNRLDFSITLTNLGATTLTDVEYLRNVDPDQGIDLGLGFSTDNQTINRPFPPGPVPIIVAASVRVGIAETRTVGLGALSVPASVIADVSILSGPLVLTDPDAVFSGAGVNRGPGIADVGISLAFRRGTLVPGESVILRFAYGFDSKPFSATRAQVAANIVQVFTEIGGSISGKKFHDFNGNGVDDGEPGLENWTINLTGPVTRTTTTDAKGNYSFTNLAGGTYTVSEVQQAPVWTQTFPPAPGTHTVLLSSGQTVTARYFGNRFAQARNANIRGIVFDDRNGNGVRDIGERGLSNWRVEVRGPVTASTQTDPNGDYAFNSLLNGTYTVSQFLPSGWAQTVPSGGQPYTVPLPNGGTRSGADFGSRIVTSVEEVAENPEEYRLFQNFPNPFNPSTRLSFTLPIGTYVTLKVYNLLGNEVATLVDGRVSAGTHNVTWDVSQESGIPSGVYIYRLVAGSFSAVKKMVLMK